MAHLNAILSQLPSFAPFPECPFAACNLPVPSIYRKALSFWGVSTGSIRSKKAGPQEFDLTARSSNECAPRQRARGWRGTWRSRITQALHPRRGGKDDQSPNLQELARTYRPTPTQFAQVPTQSNPDHHTRLPVRHIPALVPMPRFWALLLLWVAALAVPMYVHL